MAALVFLFVRLAADIPPLRADEAEVEAALHEWAVDPLDLRQATAEEIALLPWIDVATAEAIVGLAQLGQLSRLEDLLRVPGVTQAQLQAIAPFVEPAEREASGGLGSQWELRAESRTTSDDRPVGSRRLRSSSKWWRGGIREDATGQSRPAYLVGRVGEWRLGYGRLRPRSTSPLLLSDPNQRTRSAPMGFGDLRDPTVAPTLSLSAQQRSLHLGRSGGHLGWSVTADPGGGPRIWLEMAWRGRERAGSLGWVEHPDGTREGLLQMRQDQGELSARADVAGGPRAWRSFAQLRWRRPPWTWGASLTRSDVETVSARDPISMARLDRFHRAWQFDLRHVGAGLRWTLLWRRLERGPVGDRDLDHRWRLWIDPRRVERDAPRWHLRLGLDEAPRDAEAAGEVRSEIELDLHVAVEDSRGPWWRRVRAWWHGQRGAASRAVAVDLWRQSTWEIRATAAAAAGERSQPWAVGLPAAAVRVRWLHPGENLVMLSLARGHTAGGWTLRAGGWLALAWSATSPPLREGGWGFVFSRRSGAKVAR